MNTQHKLLSSCPVSCFADEIAESLDRQIEVLSRLGISYVELRSADGINVSDFTMNFAKEVKKKLDQANIRISAIGSPIGKIGIDDDFDAHLQKLSHTEQMADIFETPYIRMFSFYIPENYAAADCRSEVLFRTEAMVAEAAHNNITLLHENEKGIYGDNASRCLDLMQQFAGKHFSCTFDFANFIQCDQDPLEAYEMLSPYISYVHVKDALFATGEVVPAGTGDGHLPEIFQKLDASGYHGFLSLEPHLANFSGLAALEQRCDSHRKQHGKGVLRCLGGIPEGAGITSKSCHTAALFHGNLSHRIKPVFLLDLAKSICSFLNRF